jgi:hypothetical protein
MGSLVPLIMVQRPCFSAPQIARLRLQALGLAGQSPVASDPAGVVGHHLAMQAQNFPASRWAVGSRLPGATDAQVLAAYDAGAIVRSWPMRGTVHVVAAPDLPWMLEHLGPRALMGVRRRWDYLKIDEPFLERAREVAVELLKGGGRATRSEFTGACREAGLEMTGQRSYHAVWYLSQTGTLVHGPTRDGEHELVLLDEWIPEPRLLDRPTALRELGVRYLAARGPATLDDLVHWTKLTKTDVRKALEVDGERIVEVDGPGGPYRMLAEHLDTLDPGNAEVDRSVLALAAFDEHLLGYRGRDPVLDPEHATLVDPGRNGVFRWTLVAGGRVVGTWKRIRLTHHVRAEVLPFAPLSKRLRKSVAHAIETWARFEGVEVQVEVSNPV